MFVAIDDALAQLRDAEAVRAVVLCGEGPSFCAGLDFASFLADGRDLNGELLERDGAGANLAQRVACGWRDLEVPVIAALQGVCFGGGCQIALGADVRLAAPDTRMSVMEIKYGLVPDMGITRTLASLVRSDHARELVHTGRVVEASEALALGLVTRIVDDPRAARAGAGRRDRRALAAGHPCRQAPAQRHLRPARCGHPGPGDRAAAPAAGHAQPGRGGPGSADAARGALRGCPARRRQRRLSAWPRPAACLARRLLDRSRTGAGRPAGRCGSPVAQLPRPGPAISSASNGSRCPAS